MKIKLNGETLIAISVYLLTFYLCLPYSMVILNSFLIRFIALVSTLSFVGGMVLKKNYKQLTILLILFLFIFFYWRITWSEQLSASIYIYSGFNSLIFIFSGIALYSSKNESLLKNLFIYLTIIYIITAVTSIIGLSVFPLAAREFGRGSTYDAHRDFSMYVNIYRRMNIVSWNQVYGMIFIIPTLLMLWKIKGNILHIIMANIISLMIIMSQITFATLLTIAFITATFISVEKSAKTILLISVIASVIILVILNLELLLTLAINLSEEFELDFLSRKLTDLKFLLIYGKAIGDASARGDLYQKSLNAFLDNPIFGLILAGRSSDEIGHHSEFLDLIGTFGFIGLTIIILSFGKYFVFLKKIKKDIRKNLIIIYIGFISLFVFNPVFHSPQIFVGAFLYPLLASRYCLIMDNNNVKVKSSKHFKICWKSA